MNNVYANFSEKKVEEMTILVQNLPFETRDTQIAKIQLARKGDHVFKSVSQMKATLGFDDLINHDFQSRFNYKYQLGIAQALEVEQHLNVMIPYYNSEMNETKDFLNTYKREEEKKRREVAI